MPAKQRLNTKYSRALVPEELFVFFGAVIFSTRLFSNQFFYAFVFILISLPTVSFASTPLFSDAISDTALKRCIEKTAEKKGWQTAEQFIALKCHSKKIKSTKGLHILSRLQKLSLYNNQIESIDVNAFKHLQSLNLAKNQLKNCGIENLTELRELYLFSNKLSTLTTNNLPNLEKLKANNNALLEFKFSELSSLKKAYFFNNKLKTTTIHKLPNLKYLDVRQNPMSDPLYEEMDKLDNITILHDGNAEDWQ